MNLYKSLLFISTYVWDGPLEKKTKHTPAHGFGDIWQMLGS